MTFEDKFPELYQFFAGYFPDADFDTSSDEDVVQLYLADCAKSEIGRLHMAQASLELQELISDVSTFWREVGLIANRHFQTEMDANLWLEVIRKKFK